MILSFGLTTGRAFPLTVGSLVRTRVGRGFLRSQAAIFASRCRHRVLSAAARTCECLGLSYEQSTALAAFFSSRWVQYAAGTSYRFGNSRRTETHKQTHLFSRYCRFGIVVDFWRLIPFGRSLFFSPSSPHFSRNHLAENRLVLTKILANVLYQFSCSSYNCQYF